MGSILVRTRHLPAIANPRGVQDRRRRVAAERPWLGEGYRVHSTDQPSSFSAYIIWRPASGNPELGGSILESAHQGGVRLVEFLYEFLRCVSTAEDQERRLSPGWQNSSGRACQSLAQVSSRASCKLRTPSFVSRSSGFGTHRSHRLSEAVVERHPRRPAERPQL